MKTAVRLGPCGHRDTVAIVKMTAKTLTFVFAGRTMRARFDSQGEGFVRYAHGSRPSVRALIEVRVDG